MLKIVNASVLTPHHLIENGSVVLDAGKIKSVSETPDIQENLEEGTLDGRGHYLVPGFIDLQINGGFGCDFTGDPETIWQVGEQLPRYGVTSFLPTIITAPLEKYEAARKVVSSRVGTNYLGSNVLGLHFEGPFLNPDKRGAHDPKLMRSPDIETIDTWLDGNEVKVVTLAPELEGAVDVISRLVERDIIVSAGHTMATYSETMQAIEAGLRYGTHIFNAMRPLHHREPGVIGALLSSKETILGLIPDGLHVHPSIINSLYKSVGPERLNLVSDAMAGLGKLSGKYELGNQLVHVQEAEARLEDGTLAGSVLPLDEGLRNLIEFADCSLQDALWAVTTTPASLLGLSNQKGEIAPGYDADLVLLSADLQVVASIVDGQIVYQRDNGEKN